MSSMTRSFAVAVVASTEMVVGSACGCVLFVGSQDESHVPSQKYNVPRQLQKIQSEQIAATKLFGSPRITVVGIQI